MIQHDDIVLTNIPRKNAIRRVFPTKMDFWFPARTLRAVMTVLLLFWMASCADENAEKVATVAVEGGLFMRNGPSSRSPQIVLLPEGAIVVVMDNAASGMDERASRGKWLYVRYGKTIGWVFAAYLWEGNHRSAVLEKRRIVRKAHLTMNIIKADELKIKAIPVIKQAVYRAEHVQETCFAEKCRWNETLYFQGGRVIYVRDVDCYHDRGRGRQYGTMEIRGTKMIVKLNQGKSKTIGPNGAVTTVLMQGKNMVFVYSGLLRGFIDESVLAALGDSDIVYNRRDRYLTTTKDEINRSLCEKGNRFSDNYHLWGYFTRSVLREHNPFPGRE